jgi:Hsp70 protein/Bacterial PH domain
VAPRFLSIDYGTTHTAAAVWTEDRGPSLVALEDGHTAMPSAVYREDEDHTLVGAAAARAIPGQPTRGLRTPKRRLRAGWSFVELEDGEQTALPELIGDVMTYVYERASVELDAKPDRVCLTCPVAWREGGKKRKVLTAAAALAGIHHELQVVSEPEAAARQLGGDIRPGESCVVYDLGGGTCDIAVMEMKPGGLVLRGEAEEELGGEMFDEELLFALLDRMRDDDPEAADRLKAIHEDPAWTLDGEGDRLAETAGWRSCFALLSENVRAAKERLSSHERASVLLPPPVDRELAITREELEALIALSVKASVEALEACVKESGLEPRHLYLAGGSSRIPAVKRAVGSALGLEPVMADDPKGAIALGGLRVLLVPIVAEQRRQAEEKEARAAARRDQLAREERNRQARLEANKAKVRAAKHFDKFAPSVQNAVLEKLTGDEEVAFVVWCSSPFNWRVDKADGALVVTSKRLLFARHGALKGLRVESVPLESIFNLSNSWLNNKLTFSAEGKDFRVNTLVDQKPRPIVEYVSQRIKR